LAKGVDPCSWFGFRRRAFFALKDLQASVYPPVDLVEDLEVLIKKSATPFAAYSLSRFVQIKGESVTARLMGRRAHRSFFPAPIPDKKLQSAKAFVADLNAGLADLA
jgi:hypothetical protein